MSDRGITLMRKRFFDDLKRIERGEEPSGLIRDPAKNECIGLPIASRSFLVDSVPLEEMMADPTTDPRVFMTIAGIPESVRVDMLSAVGLDAKGERIEGATTVFATAGAAKAGTKTLNWWS